MPSCTYFVIPKSNILQSRSLLSLQSWQSHANRVILTIPSCADFVIPNSDNLGNPELCNLGNTECTLFVHCQFRNPNLCRFVNTEFRHLSILICYLWIPELCHLVDPTFCPLASSAILAIPDSSILTILSSVILAIPSFSLLAITSLPSWPSQTLSLGNLELCPLGHPENAILAIKSSLLCLGNPKLDHAPPPLVHPLIIILLWKCGLIHNLVGGPARLGCFPFNNCPPQGREQPMT